MTRASPIRVVVTGAGFGARIQVPGFRASGRFEVVALVGRDLERSRRVAAELGVPRAFTALGAALGAVDADAVSVPAPAAHAEQARDRGRQARPLREADAATSRRPSHGGRRTRRQGRRADRSQFPSTPLLARILAAGDLGTPRLLVACDDLSLYVAPHRTAPSWWFDAAQGGGWLGASGSHLIDAARVWLGEMRRVIGVVERLGAPGTADDTFSLIVEFAGGTRGVLHQSAAMLGPRASSLRIAGSEGTAWLDEEWRLWTARPGREPILEPIPADLLGPAVDIPKSAGPFAARELPCFLRQAEAFADRIEGRPRSGPEPATFDDGVAVQRVMAAARRGEWTDL
jgi:predicted dehydrogenase